MKKSFRSKNILLVVILALLVFVGGNIYFSNPDNLARLAYKKVIIKKVLYQSRF